MDYIQFRLALPDDKLFLFELYASTRKHELASWGWTEEQATTFIDFQWKALQASRKTQAPNAVNTIVTYETTPVGHFLLNKTSSNLHLIDFIILPAYRNQGIGTYVIHMLQQQSDQLGLPILLHVYYDNPAALLYNRLGFTFIDTTDSVYRAMVWTPIHLRH